MSILERFLRYVQIDTRADDSSQTCPTTAGQLELQRLLAGELRDNGLSDVSVDDNGYLMATIPATAGAEYAYTLDGGNAGELEFESFSADVMRLTFIGFNTHPGYAKGKMVNAIRAASRFVDRLPRERLSPETTDGHDGFVHPYQMDAS